MNDDVHDPGMPRLQAAASAAFCSFAGQLMSGVFGWEDDPTAVAAARGWAVVGFASRVFPLLGPPGEPHPAGPARFLHDLARDHPDVYAALAEILAAWQATCAERAEDYAEAEDGHDLADFWRIQFESATMVVAMLPGPTA